MQRKTMWLIKFQNHEIKIFRSNWNIKPIFRDFGIFGKNNKRSLLQARFPLVGWIKRMFMSVSHMLVVVW